MTMLLSVLFLGAVGSPPPDSDDDADKPNPPGLVAPVPVTKPHLGRVTAPADEDDKPSTPSAHSGVQEVDRDNEEAGAQPSSTIVVTARRLDNARTQIDAGLGATVYSLSNEAVENRPGGETGSISDILAQAPGVTLSGNVLNIRGSRPNQVRINNVIIPEAISDPADQLTARLAETTRLITGTLPAQFGFAPAGVISVTTKNGLYQHGGQAEMFAGSDGMLEPALEWARSVRGTSLFASGSVEHVRSTVAGAEGIRTHDRRNAIEALGFADHVIDAENRVSLIVGGADERHRIGQTSIGSGTEKNSDAYLVGTFQHSDGEFTVQAALTRGTAFDRSQFSEPTHERRSSLGTQIDATRVFGTLHTLRFGLLATRSTARELDFGGKRSRTARTTVGLYAQDEWKIAASLTFNPGARVEWLRGFDEAAKIEPRASLVWQQADGFTGHVGYARYASAPPLGVPTPSLPDERDDYFDAGVQQKFGPLTLGLDGYSRSVRNYIAEHQTLGSAVATPFTFERARINGLEFSATYARGATSAWANLSLERAKGKTILGGDELFPASVLAAASKHSVPLGSDRPVTVSGGMTQRIGKLSLSGDLLVSSGTVRTLDLGKPNGSRHSPYVVVGLAAVYHARIAGEPADLRLDLTNLTDLRYVSTDATNLEGGWTRRGRGRAITLGIEQGF